LKNPFTTEEDTVVIDAKQQGLSWSDIAKKLHGRTADQVRTRFVNTIDPTLVKCVGWTDEEDQLMQQAQMELGNKWSSIAQLLPGRSENDVKNHWYNTKVRARRQLKSSALTTRRIVNLESIRCQLSDATIDINDNDRSPNPRNSSVGTPPK
jgi:Myb-like DNA-binding domain